MSMAISMILETTIGFGTDGATTLVIDTILIQSAVSSQLLVG